jgi:hypothetical protein
MTTRPSDERGVVAPSRLMLIAIVVVAVAGAMFVATSPGSDDTASAKGSTAKVAAPTASPKTSSSATAGATGKTAPTPSSTPSKATGKKPGSTPSASASASAGAEQSAPAQAVKRAKTRVSVFNNSGKKGLAKRTAGKVSGVGWKVVGTDNWYGTIPTTTVYYPKNLQAAAKVLARDLGIRRVKPAIKPMRSDRLTVILTADYTA